MGINAKAMPNEIKLSRSRVKPLEGGGAILGESVVCWNVREVKGLEMEERLTKRWIEVRFSTDGRSGSQR